MIIYVNSETKYDAYVGSEPVVLNPINPFIPSSGGNDDDDLEEGAIYGIVGGIALLLLLILIGFTIYKKR